MRPWQLGKGSVRPKWHGGVVLDGMLLCWLGGVVKRIDNYTGMKYALC